NFKYSDQEVFNPALYIAESQWKLTETLWFENNSTTNSNQVTFNFNINQMYTMVDIKGNQYAGTWAVRKRGFDSYLVLDEGKVIEEKYKVIDINSENKTLSLEKINSSSGNLNVTYLFQAM
ncbi:MAG: hypothetical protein AAGI07_10920, partial [Bacteroidota bacterium]